MIRLVLSSLILLLALSGCGGESRIEATDGASSAEPADGPAPAPASKKAPSEAAGSETTGAKAPGAGKTKDSRPPAEGKARTDPDAAAASAPAKPVRKAGAKGTSATAAGKVAAIISDLKRDPQAAREAFLKIWEVPPSLIPNLIEEVENGELSKLEQVQILVLDPDFLRPGEVKPFLANRIHGLGRMEILDESNRDDIRLVSQEYTKMSYGITPNKHYKVVLERFGGFPIGVVVRAGLINRLRSIHYPPGSDDAPGAGKLIAWWRDFYGLARAELKAALPSK